MIQVSPDIGFIEKLQRMTGSQVSTCMQCGACTASCTLSEEQDVFPRKQMILAAWGMREQLMADPYVWTCHGCGDCTLSCPRGVKPGEILAAVREEQIAHYSRPRFLARWMKKPAFLPLALLFPVAAIAGILSLAGTFRIPEGPVDYSKFFPHAWLNVSFTALFILSTLGAVTGLRKFIGNLSLHNRLGETGPETGKPKIPGNQSPSENSVPANPASRSSTEISGPGNPVNQTRPFRGILHVLGRILAHRDFNRCGEQKSRALSHFLVFWGFILLLFVTFFAILSTLFFQYPLGFLNPVKLAGNLGGLMLLTGSSLMILQRLSKPESLQSRYPDWFFLVVFWLLVISGMFVEGARFLEWKLAYHLYFFHLVMVWIIILYYPYTKFAHFLYRSTALILVKSGRQSARSAL